MVSPLAGSLAKTINKAFKNIFFDAVLSRQVIPESPAYDPADPPAAVPVSYSCKALRDNYSRHDRADGSILSGDAKILILVNSLSVDPMKNDIILYQGVSFSIIEFDVDPANAVWIIQGRK